MSWLSLTIFAQVLSSVASLLDKYLVTSKRMTTPILYVFYTGVLAIVGLLIYIPGLFTKAYGLPQFADITLLSLWIIFVLICASSAQLGGLWGLFSAFKKSDASDVVPVVGSISAIFALGISYVFLGVTLPVHFTIGFGFLVFGTLFISHLRFNKKTFFFTLLAGISFSISSLFLKYAINEVSFVSIFFWYSLILSCISLLLLFSKKIRKTFHTQRKEKHARKTGIILIINKLFAGVAGVLLIKAIEVGEVSLVQALGGLQFVFLFLIAIIIGPHTSIDFGENVKRKDVYQKLTAISIIVIGFVLLFI